MIGAINTNSSANIMSPPRNEQPLTDAQQTILSETLSGFDSENLTEQDALSIVEAFKEAGIQPGKVLADAMTELGFDAREIGELAGIGTDKGNMPPPPPPSQQQSNESITSIVDYLTELLEQKLSDGESLSDEEKEDIYAQVIEKFGLQQGDSIINTTV